MTRGWMAAVLMGLAAMMGCTTDEERAEGEPASVAPAGSMGPADLARSAPSFIGFGRQIPAQGNARATRLGPAVGVPPGQQTLLGSSMFGGRTENVLDGGNGYFNGLRLNNAAVSGSNAHKGQGGAVLRDVLPWRMGGGRDVAPPPVVRDEESRLERDFRLEEARLASQVSQLEGRVEDLQKAEPTREPPVENTFHAAEGDDATSTFAIDVDTASYTFVKRFLTHESLPPPDLVRLEELINRFELADPAPPVDGRPFAARVEVAGCPWRAESRLVRVSLRGREVKTERRPVSNLVFLIDVSGSMSSPERLPLVQAALRELVEQLGERDRVALVVYAGASGLVLPPTCGEERGKILEAIDDLQAGGSTNGGAGIQLAYRTAIEAYVEGGCNRVVLCTDGDFNVGVSDPAELEALIAEKKKAGVFLTCLGFGVYGGDQRLETLADKGDGNYAAIDDLREAERVLVDEMSGTLVTIAKDVKVQVAFDPERVARWRLIGYENRVMANEDFADDQKDGGEIGAGHRVTALYEVEPAALAPSTPGADLLTLRLRWKQPDGDTSELLEVAARDGRTSFERASPDLRFAASVAAGGMLMRGSAHAGTATYARAIEWARGAKGPDPRGERAEWIDLLERAGRLTPQPIGGARRAAEGNDG